MTSLQVFLPDDAVERITALAAEAGRSPDAFLTEAILDYLLNSARRTGKRPSQHSGSQTRPYIDGCNTYTVTVTDRHRN